MNLQKENTSSSEDDDSDKDAGFIPNKNKKAKFSYGTAERRMLPLILSWASTAHKMQGTTVDYAVVYLGWKLLVQGQAYVIISRVRSLDGLRIEELDASKITGKTCCNVDALDEIERIRQHL
ncbi:ATP-dependent DNA helicase PIF1-like [Acyrthosiphon pisum]|uniref:ATP-dependent DNA helicase n=1 Tax=Acyrthosiphon pisum TaxID=7029 RepID=A0A8R2D274_ACYPI|nr:ATP-dependent DNA helicase PIF1-like [Acyrthosiphon pisum]|eukprot:XP_016657391.1 PREDICTED: ATP-dependent DNA helicase PIF1-like [Acyrthosiphon pisum]